MTEVNIKWVVYIIQAISGKLYTGITNNMERRLAVHAAKKGARFFHFSCPEKVVFQEIHSNRSEATKREIAIKNYVIVEFTWIGADG
jgi:putative endonuclease